MYYNKNRMHMGEKQRVAMKAATRFGGPCYILVLLIYLGFVAHSRGQEQNQAYLTISYGESITSSAVKDLDCAVRSIASYFTVNFAGIDLDTFGRDACGTCISISCVNPSDCRGGSETNVVAAVLDDAGSPDIVQVNSFIARRLTGKPESELADIPVQWSFISCDAYGLVIGGAKENGSAVAESPSSSVTITPLPENDTESQIAEPVAEPVAEPPLSSVTITPLPENITDSQIAQPDAEPAMKPVTDSTSSRITITPLNETEMAESDEASPFNDEFAKMWLGDFSNRLPKAACGFSEATYLQRENWAAVNIFNFRSKYGFHPCGLCAEVRCSDADDCQADKTLEVIFVDDCGSCSAGDLLISKQGQEVLGATSKKAAIPIEWKLVPCKPPRGIFMSVYTNNPYYHRIAFSGLSAPIDRVTINGMMSTRNQNGQFEFYADLTAGAKPFEITLRATSGETIQTYVQNLYSQPLRIQF